MKQIDLTTFLLNKTLYCTRSIELVEDVLDFSVTEYYTAGGELLLKRVSQESYDEADSYGWVTKYYIVEEEIL